LLPSNPTAMDTSTTAKMLSESGDQCRLDVSMHACQQFYVGNAAVDKNTKMMEICCEIAGLRQEYRDNHGRTIMESPEELFIKFLAYAGSLPDCAKGWPIQLCSIYYMALSSTFSSRMMSDGTYTSPSLVGLDMKKAQLETLHVVREGATFQFKELAEEDDCINKKLKLMIRLSGRTPQSSFAGGYENNDTRGRHMDIDSNRSQGQNSNFSQGQGSSGSRSYHSEGQRDVDKFG